MTPHYVLWEAQVLLSCLMVMTISVRRNSFSCREQGVREKKEESWPSFPVLMLVHLLQEGKLPISKACQYTCCCVNLLWVMFGLEVPLEGVCRIWWLWLQHCTHHNWYTYRVAGQDRLKRAKGLGEVMCTKIWAEMSANSCHIVIHYKNYLLFFSSSRHYLLAKGLFYVLLQRPCLQEISV